MRADARRNYERVLSAARIAFAERGPDTSLEDIARRAGVGSATLHRHFPGRDALLLAVLSDSVQRLSARAEDLLTAPSPGAALTAWLRAFITHASTYGGLAASLVITEPDQAAEDPRHLAIYQAGEALLRRARQAGEIRADVTISELLKLANGIALATEPAEPADTEPADTETPDAGTADTGTVDRLLSLVIEGVRPR